jgi:hypothetical protein
MPGGERGRSASRISINRAPVLTLWAAVVAERLGYAPAEALTLGRAVAGLNAQSKGRRLGIFKPPAAGAERPRRTRAIGAGLEVELLGRSVPAVRTPAGLRAVGKSGTPESHESVERYLAGGFGPALEAARSAMRALARSRHPQELAQVAFSLYESFRPEVPRGQAGWGAKGMLDLERIRSLTRRAAR